ncbi:MAG: crossover junction endodeoxyribonuclease RuvC [Candidatus Paceibacterota bacterium]
MIILGIDPGTTRIGYGVIKKENNKFSHLKSGILEIKEESNASKILSLEMELEKIINKFKPDKIGVEKIFFSKNKKTAIKVAEARGVILSLVYKKSIPVAEMEPSKIKLAVTGNGRSSKKGVAKMVHYFLKIPTNELIDDETDALAIAIATDSYIKTSP